jgi:SAM-dependent methyltransferase
MLDDTEPGPSPTGDVPAHAVEQREIVPPRPDPRGFRRELTPTWLSTATLLGGHRPPDLSRPFRAAYVGCGTGITPAVVASVHPESEIWAWDFRVDQVEATRLLRDAAALSNLDVHEQPDLPSDLGGGLCDIIVVAGVLDVVDDDLRTKVIAAVGANLRPGGVLCVTYRTAVGWIEIAPVQRLMRYVAQRDTGDPDGVVPRVLSFLEQLRDGGARYLTERPYVAGWLTELLANKPDHIAIEYLEDDLRPISHAELVDLLADTRCTFLGSAHLTDELDLDVPDALAEMVTRAKTPVLRETYRDLGVRRSTRADIFRCGKSRSAPAEFIAALGQLQLVGVTRPVEPLDSLLDVGVWEQLELGSVSASSLDPDIEEVVLIVRSLLDAGLAHPALAGGVTAMGITSARKLNVALDGLPAARDGHVIAAPLLGSAIPRDLAFDNDRLARLGVC